MIDIKQELLNACKLAQVRIALLEGSNTDTYKMLTNIINRTENKCCYHGCEEPLYFLGLYLCKTHGEIASVKDCEEIEKHMEVLK